MYKTKLQELCHKCFWDLAEYVTLKEGPDHCPRFTGKCTVRGICFETPQTPQNECKSSKEAQNLAAKVAFEHLSSLQNMAVPHPITSPPPSSLPSPGFVFCSNKNVNFKTASSEELTQKNLALDSGGQSAPAKDNLPKGTPHVYKNRLQNWVQKNSRPLPIYSCEFDGPPHARRFRATVTIDGKQYKTVDFFPTLREAEQSTAKIALETLSDDAIQDDSVYKSLLQEFSQRNGMRLPTYNTEKIGPSHAATFKCTLEIGSQTFYGVECKTKKLAEMNAAKIAFNNLTQNTDPHNSGNNSLQSAKNELQTHVEVASGEIGSSSVNGKNKATRMSSNRGEYNENGGDVTGKETNAKKLKKSTWADDKHLLINAVPHFSPTDAAGKPGGDTTTSSKIVIYSRESSTMPIPQGASILPCSNDKWLVTSQECDQNC